MSVEAKQVKYLICRYKNSMDLRKYKVWQTVLSCFRKEIIHGNEYYKALIIAEMSGLFKKNFQKNFVINLHAYCFPEWLTFFNPKIEFPNITI